MVQLPEYAWIQVTPTRPWKLILPTTKRKIQSHPSIPLYLGHYNQSYSMLVRYKNESPLKEAFPIRLSKTSNMKYKAGPLVGILTTEGAKGGFRGNRRNFKDIIRMGIKTGILIYVFTAESIDPLTKEVKAYLYIPSQNKWLARTMPLPDVIYNRISSRREEEKSIVKSTIQFFKNEGVPFFNPTYFNKWTLYQWMKDSDELKNIVPDTAYLSKESLQSFLQSAKMLYLKPIYGKAGKGFMKIEKLPSSYLLTYQAQQIQYHHHTKYFNSLWEKIQKLTKNTPYILQKGIHLTTYQERPYDLRILAQKNGLGKWNISGIGVRQAGNKSITTHVPRGGSIQSFDKVISQSFDPIFREELKQRLSSLSIKIAKHMEKKVGHSLGEISLDIGLDQSYRIWFFEANAKPMEFDEPDIRETSLLRLMQYFRYLSGFIPKEVVS